MTFLDIMRYISAYLLSNLGGNSNPSEKDLKKILSSVGIEFNEEESKRFLEEVKKYNSMSELINKGLSKFASMPAVSSSSAASGPAASAAKTGGSKEAAAPQKVEKEESDEEMGFGLFD